MTKNRWELNYSWVLGQSYRDSPLLELEGTFSEPNLAAKVLVHLVELGEAHPWPNETSVVQGGALARLEQGRIVVSSSGEDGCDSIKYLSDLVAAVAETIDPTVAIDWLERAPRSATGVAAVRIDGYWIPAAEADTYYERRDSALARLLAASIGRVDAYELADDDGPVTAVFTKAGEQVAEIGLGIGVLELIEEAEAESVLDTFLD